MELVYLWVEKYKNIHNQGFNFSPQFECEYEDGNLTICDKKKDECKDNNYIENFFGNSINVTAIVGKNGSGKSSVLKLILYLIFCKNYKKFEKEGDYNIGRLVSTLKQFSNKELFLLIYNGQELKKITFSSFIRHLQTIEFGDEITTRMLSGSSIRESEVVPHIAELSRDELNFFTIHFNYMLDTMYDGVQDNWIKEIYHKADTYQTPLLLEPYKNNNNKQLIDLDIIEYLNNQNMLRFYSKFGIEKNNIIDFFKPTKVTFYIKKRINEYSFIIDKEFTNSDISNLFDLYKSGEDIKFLIFKYFQLKIKRKENLSSKSLLVATKIDKLYEKEEFKVLNKIYIAFKVLGSEKFLFNEVKYKKIEKWFLDIEITQKIEIDFEYTDLLQDNCPEYEIQKIKVCLEFENNKIYNKDEFKNSIGNKNKIETIKNILKFIPPWIEVEWFEDDKSIKSLSSGEKTFFTFIINLMYQIQNINDKPKYNTINLFLDETELGFHPQWQKEYLIKIVNAIKQVNNKKINLIFATHSPFLLSDLPKENVIFLDTYKKGEDSNQEKGNCKNVTKTTTINPFGANIHTLLSDGFFMEDGLMGEFAKGKINEIIAFFNNKNKLYENDKDKLLNIINTIGEPFLREKLLKMYDKKYPKTNEERITELQKQIDELR